jgi:hypothetical protein
MNSTKRTRTIVGLVAVTALLSACNGTPGSVADSIPSSIGPGTSLNTSGLAAGKQVFGSARKPVSADGLRFDPGKTAAILYVSDGEATGAAYKMPARQHKPPF